MKNNKKNRAIFALLVALCAALVLVACDGKEEHKHDFTEQNTDAVYLKTNATCTEAAVYYLSCSCGEKGTETFTSGDPLPHIKRYRHNGDNTHNNIARRAILYLSQARPAQAARPLAPKKRLVKSVAQHTAKRMALITPTIHILLMPSMQIILM